jgi:hypothetical protein
MSLATALIPFVAIPAVVILFALAFRKGAVRAVLSLPRFSFTLEATDQYADHASKPIDSQPADRHLSA